MNSDFHWAKEVKQRSLFAISIIRKSLVRKINFSGLGKIRFSPWPNRTLIFNVEHNHRGGGGLVAKLYPTLVTPWAVACQAPLSIEFPRQEYCSGLPFPSPGDLPRPGIKPVPLALADRFFNTEPPRNPNYQVVGINMVLGLGVEVENCILV